MKQEDHPLGHKTNGNFNNKTFLFFLFQVDSQKQFIILCGNITYVTVSNFLDDFFHPAREDVNCEVVIINKMSPDLEFEGLLKRMRTKVQFFQVNFAKKV